jgi:hypothetical protein
MNNKTKTRRFANVFIAVLVILLTASPLFAKPEGKKKEHPTEPGKKTGQLRLTKEKIEGILEHIEMNRPQKAQQLRELRKEDPKEFRKQIRKMTKNWADKKNPHKKDFANMNKKQQRPQRRSKGRRNKDRSDSFQSCHIANADAPLSCSPQHKGRRMYHGDKAGLRKGPMRKGQRRGYQRQGRGPRRRAMSHGDHNGWQKGYEHQRKGFRNQRRRNMMSHGDMHRPQKGRMNKRQERGKQSFRNQRPRRRMDIDESTPHHRFDGKPQHSEPHIDWDE